MRYTSYTSKEAERRNIYVASDAWMKEYKYQFWDGYINTTRNDE